jgi:hypothetical protein
MAIYTFKYLGIPMQVTKLKNADWNVLLERIEKKLSSSKGKHLSVGGRLVLINSVLISLPMFMMSFFEIPRVILRKLDYLMSRFFWQADTQKKKYRLAKWDILCQPKDMGGLGIKNIDTQNKCLLSKWLFKLINEEGLWQEVIRKKYLCNKSIGQVRRKPGDSHFWTGLMKVRDMFLERGVFTVNNGRDIRFWEDRWLGNFTLQQRFPSLYNLVHRKNDIVANVCATSPLNVSFRRGLVGVNLQNWYNLVSLVVNVSLNNSSDKFQWGLHQNGQYSVKSFYDFIIGNGRVRRDQTVWKLKMPLKIKIFSWYLRRGVILTKGSLTKRNWNDNRKCVFCLDDESIQHLFFDYHYAKFIWRVVSFTFGLKEPTNTEDIYNSWLINVNARWRSLILVGATTICWALWLCRNDVVFYKIPIQTYMQVLFRGIY